VTVQGDVAPTIWSSAGRFKPTWWAMPTHAGPASIDLSGSFAEQVLRGVHNPSCCSNSLPTISMSGQTG